MGDIEVNGTRLAYDEAGSGPAIVFSHAALADRRMWDHQFEHLTETNRVIRYDWRGYGDSADATGTYSHAEDLLALLDALAVEDATLVGCSMGGGHCVDVALAAPERVTGLVLFCAGLNGRTWPEPMQEYVKEHVRPAVPAERIAAYQRGEPVRDGDARAMAEAHGRFLIAGPGRDPSTMDAAVYAKAMDMATGVFRRLWSGPPSREKETGPPNLGGITANTLVVNGTEDAPWIQDLQNEIARTVPRARRVDLPDTGHLPPLERPDESTKLIAAHAQ
ncbi:alpha/beta hydrolase [Virgisporangium ochraceum]|uniref:Alpha/beta hydrolase n=1 Tax=Virgisporangium ochraceum TaxID=65505 RepID=A0A8J4A2S0_9ACTN|nr:alpha/beta hydrolase [Virgisporangium ochraceum]GIJ72320.1 alpha/beta hydrolase [Virgisporangium ochraceum]